MSTLVEIGKTRNCVKTLRSPPFGRRVSTQFLVFPISTSVDITVYISTVYQHGKCFIFVKCNLSDECHIVWYEIK